MHNWTFGESRSPTRTCTPCTALLRCTLRHGRSADGRCRLQLQPAAMPWLRAASVAATGAQGVGSQQAEFSPLPAEQPGSQQHHDLHLLRPPTPPLHAHRRQATRSNKASNIEALNGGAPAASNKRVHCWRPAMVPCPGGGSDRKQGMS